MQNQTEPQHTELVWRRDSLVLTYMLDGQCYEATLDGTQTKLLPKPSRDMRLFVDQSCRHFLEERINWLLQNTERTPVQSWEIFLIRKLLREEWSLRADLAFYDYEHDGRGRSHSLDPASREGYDAFMAFRRAWWQLEDYLSHEPGITARPVNGNGTKNTFLTYFAK